jgi:hypothetical protein
VIGPAFFVSGFIVRELGAFDYTNLVKYIVSICLVYIAPYVATHRKPPSDSMLTGDISPLYELANYHVLGRVLYLVPYHSPIHPGRVLTTFAGISIIIEALNGNGASYSANASSSQEKQDIGKAMLKAALLLQLLLVALFVSLAGYFHAKCRRNGIDSPRVNKALLTLYISSAIITTRTIYRTVEYFDLSNLNFRDPNIDPTSISPVLRYEWFFYVFEASLMLANSVLMNVRHPRRWLPDTTKVYLARDGVTEIVGPGYKQERNFFASLFDPFDICGVIRGRDKKSRFWDEEALTLASQKSNTGAGSGNVI